MSGYLPVLIFAAFIVGFAVVSLVAARLLRPSRPDAVKLMNYECGAEPVGSAWIQFPVGFYLVALVFI
ncbi:MAG: NADH-quinone oxidoreductase subunit A, partial [Candidatus Rokuibacteriota bacterium]